jgi:hypothetical protein
LSVADPKSGIDEEGRWTPVFAGQPPPAARGNSLAETHRSYISESKLSADPCVLAHFEWIRETQPVSHPADDGACWRLALVYRRLELSATALEEADAVTPGRPLASFTDKAAWLGRLREDHARWLREAGRIEAELARTPASRAKLGLHIAQGKRALSLVELHAQAALEDMEGAS